MAREWTHGAFYWNELMTRDAERDKKFYADTLGWSFDAMPTPDGGTYWIAKGGGDIARHARLELRRHADAGCGTYWVAKAGEQPSAAFSTSARRSSDPCRKAG